MTRSNLLQTAKLAGLSVLVLVGLGMTIPAQAQMGPPGMGGARVTQVGVVTLTEDKVPYTTTVPGRATAFEEVDIRPRVSGVISEIAYVAGQPVQVGDVLFTVEDQTYRAQKAAAQASLDLANAALEAAKDTVSRYERLVGTGVTAQELATARVSMMQAEADLSAAQTSLELAQLDLDRTVITSPIAGFPSVPTVSVGALVTANQTDALTTVTRLDPIYVDVEESSRRIGEIRNRIATGALEPGSALDIALELETGETYAGKGEMVSPANSVSTTTGTTEIRIRFDNPDRKIMPGQFLRVDVVLGTTRAVLVPQGATSRAASGALTAFVAVDGKAEKRVLTEEGSYQNAWIVTKGVLADELLIVDGLSNLADGAQIEAIPVTIGPDGVVQEVAATEPVSAGAGE